MDDQCPMPRSTQVLLTIVISNQDTGLISPKVISKCPLDSVTIQANGPHNFYWSTGEVGSSIKVVDAGIYSVYYDTLGIRIMDEVEVKFTDPVHSALLSDNIYSQCLDPVVLTAPTTYLNPIWIGPADTSFGSSFQPLESGNYILEMSDQDGCIYFDDFEFVKIDHTDTVYNICKVTVDHMTNKCVVAFENLAPFGIDSIHLYRLDGWGQPNLLVGLPGDIYSFLDHGSNPVPYGEGYWMVVQDTCDNISDLSGVRRNIVLLGPAGGYGPQSLSWNALTYDSISSYKVYLSENNGPFELLTETNPATTSFGYDASLYDQPKFFIRADIQSACPISPTDSLPNAVFSNILDLTTISVQEQNLQIDIFPNPSSGLLEIRSSEPWRTVEIFDMKGRIIRRLEWSEDMRIDISDLSSGLYSLVLTSENKRHVELIERR